tara:strand:+ start:214 stop:885 length:672 start_codon:yes stop_codon:yes gene_type:complete
MKNKMKTLGLKYGTDKICEHNYHEIYPQFIKDLYNKDGGILEVGLLGGASLNLWLDLFPNMHIYGMDLNPNDKILNNKRHTIIKGDQSSYEDLKNTINLIKHPLWFINDDGSHIPEHQILTFNTLFPKLEDGGVYIIEDIEVSYWTRGHIYGYKTEYGLRHPKSIIEIFKSSIDGVNYRFSRNKDLGKVMHQDYFHSITFAKNCIIIVKKKQKNKDYLFSPYL